MALCGGVKIVLSFLDLRKKEGWGFIFSLQGFADSEVRGITSQKLHVFVSAVVFWCDLPSAVGGEGVRELERDDLA